MYTRVLNVKYNLYKINIQGITSIVILKIVYKIENLYFYDFYYFLLQRNRDTCIYNNSLQQISFSLYPVIFL